MNLILTSVCLLLSLAWTGEASGSDKYERACPTGSRCYGALGNYSAIGYRGCIRTFDCSVQVNIVPQKNRHLGGFDYFYHVCLRVPNTTLTMFFTPKHNETQGNGLIQAKIRTTGKHASFKSFVRDGQKELTLAVNRHTAHNVSGFHLSNEHLVKAYGFDEDEDRSMGTGDEAAAKEYMHSAEGMPIMDCENIVMFFSQAKLFYHLDNTNPTRELNLKSSEKLYLKLKVETHNGTVIEDVTMTLTEPGSGRVALITIIVITALVMLTCTKCCDFCSCCLKCCASKPKDVEAQTEVPSKAIG